MASVVQGKDCVFQVDLTGDYKTILCSKSFAIVTTTEEVETTTISDGSDPEEGLWRDFDFHSLGYTINLDGILKNYDATNDTAWILIIAQTSFLEVPFRAIYRDAEGNVNIVTGIVLVKGSTLGASSNSFVSTTTELIGKGKYTLSTAIADYRLVDFTYVPFGGSETDFTSGFMLEAVGGCVEVDDHTIRYDYPIETVDEDITVTFRLDKVGPDFAGDWSSPTTTGLLNLVLSPITDMTTYWAITATFNVVNATADKKMKFNKLV